MVEIAALTTLWAPSAVRVLLFLSHGAISSLILADDQNLTSFAANSTRGCFIFGDHIHLI
jgi:hypothetical protein